MNLELSNENWELSKNGGNKGKDSFYEGMASVERITEPLFFEVTERKSSMTKDELCVFFKP